MIFLPDGWAGLVPPGTGPAPGRAVVVDVARLFALILPGDGGNIGPRSALYCGPVSAGLKSGSIPDNDPALRSVLFFGDRVRDRERWRLFCGLITNNLYYC